MKKIFIVLIVTFIMLFSVSFASAEANTVNPISVFINGERLTFDVQPVVENGRVLVPLRAVFEALGVEVDWGANAGIITAIKDGTVIRLTVDSSKAYVDGLYTQLDVPTRIIDNRTVVPLRFVSESFGATVKWNACSRTVTINTDGYAVESSLFEAIKSAKNSEFEFNINHCTKGGISNECTFIKGTGKVNGGDYQLTYNITKESSNIVTSYTTICKDNKLYTKMDTNPWQVADLPVSNKNLIPDIKMDIMLDGVATKERKYEMEGKQVTVYSLYPLNKSLADSLQTFQGGYLDKYQSLHSAYNCTVDIEFYVSQNNELVKEELAILSTVDFQNFEDLEMSTAISLVFNNIGGVTDISVPFL